MHVVETVCKGFEEYAQAKYKSSGEPTIIRLMTHEGNMSPLMSQVDMVPDEDLNTKLKFYVSMTRPCMISPVRRNLYCLAVYKVVYSVHCTVYSDCSSVHVATSQK